MVLCIICFVSPSAPNKGNTQMLTACAFSNIPASLMKTRRGKYALPCQQTKRLIVYAVRWHHTRLCLVTEQFRANRKGNTASVAARKHFSISRICKGERWLAYPSRWFVYAEYNGRSYSRFRMFNFSPCIPTYLFIISIISLSTFTEFTRQLDIIWIPQSLNMTTAVQYRTT